MTLARTCLIDVCNTVHVNKKATTLRAKQGHFSIESFILDKNIQECSLEIKFYLYVFSFAVKNTAK